MNNITLEHLSSNSTDNFLQEVQIFMANMLSPWLNESISGICQYAYNDILIDTNEAKQENLQDNLKKDQSNIEINIVHDSSKLKGSLLKVKMKNAEKINKITRKSKNRKSKNRLEENLNGNTSNNSMKRSVTLNNLSVNSKPRNGKLKSRNVANKEKSTRNRKSKKNTLMLSKDNNELMFTKLSDKNNQHNQKIIKMADLAKRKSIISTNRNTSSTNTKTRAINYKQNEGKSQEEENKGEKIKYQRQNADVIAYSHDTLKQNGNNESANVKDTNIEPHEEVTVGDDFSNGKSIISKSKNTTNTEKNGWREYDKQSKLVSSNKENIGNISYKNEEIQKIRVTEKSNDTLKQNNNNESTNENVTNIEPFEEVTANNGFSNEKLIIYDPRNTTNTKKDSWREYDKKNEVISSNKENISIISNDEEKTQNISVFTSHITLKNNNINNSNNEFMNISGTSSAHELEKEEFKNIFYNGKNDNDDNSISLLSTIHKEIKCNLIIISNYQN